MFVLGVTCLVALVPLGVWLATGSRSHAVRALRGYGGFLLALLALAGAGSLVGIVGAALMQ